MADEQKKNPSNDPLGARLIAFALVGIFAGWSLAAMFVNFPTENRPLAALLVNLLSAGLGAAFGYMFGVAKKNEGKHDEKETL
jgi:fluoride ion exporter CrcB/FEX